MDWLKSFKVALIEQNIDTLSKLLDTMPNFESIEQMKEAQYLIAQAEALLLEQKEQMAQEMDKVRRNIKFIRSQTQNKIHRLDITS